MKKRIGKCTKCGESLCVQDLTGKKTKIKCLTCGSPMPIIYEDDGKDPIETKELDIEDFGYSLIGIEEQEDRAIETGEDDEILFYVPYEVFLKSDRYIKKYVEANIC